jgi:hypothetical protein
MSHLVVAKCGLTKCGWQTSQNIGTWTDICNTWVETSATSRLFYAFGRRMDYKPGVGMDEEFEALNLGDSRPDRRAEELLKWLTPTANILNADLGRTLLTYSYDSSEAFSLCE